MKITGYFSSFFLFYFSIFKYLEESSNPKIEEIFKEIPCAVCQSASSGIHFGTTTCEVLFDFSFLFKSILKMIFYSGLQRIFSSNDKRTFTTRL